MIFKWKKNAPLPAGLKVGDWLGEWSHEKISGKIVRYVEYH